MRGTKTNEISFKYIIYLIWNEITNKKMIEKLNSNERLNKIQTEWLAFKWNSFVLKIYLFFAGFNLKRIILIES